MQLSIPIRAASCTFFDCIIFNMFKCSLHNIDIRRVKIIARVLLKGTIRKIYEEEILGTKLSLQIFLANVDLKHSGHQLIN